MSYINQNSAALAGTYWPGTSGNVETADNGNATLNSNAAAVPPKLAILPQSQHQFLNSIAQLRNAAAQMKISQPPAAAPRKPSVDDIEQQEVDRAAEEQGWYMPLRSEDILKLRNDPNLQSQLRHSVAPGMTFSRLTGHSIQLGKDQVKVSQEASDKNGGQHFKVQIGEHTISVQVPETMDADRVLSQVIKSYQGLPDEEKKNIHSVVYHPYPDTAKTHPPAGRSSGTVDLYYSEGNGLHDYSEQDFKNSAGRAADHSVLSHFRSD